MPSIRLAFVCLFSLFLVASVWADEPIKGPSLQDAKTMFDIFDYMNHETGKIDNIVADPQQRAALRADIYIRATDKLLEIAEDDHDRSNAYIIRLEAFECQIEAEIEGAQQKMETFLDELAAKDETRDMAAGLRFLLFISDAMKTINTPEGLSAFMSGLKTWIYRDIDFPDPFMSIRVDRIGRGMLQVAARRENVDSAEQFATELIEELIEFIQSAECTLSAEEKAMAIRHFKRLELYQFGLFHRKALETVHSPDSFDAFKAELKAWINRRMENFDTIPQLGLLIAEKNGVPAEQIINELIEFLQSPECTAIWKEHGITGWVKMPLTAVGSELKLYGRTLDDKDFDWASLRGQYVLVQFTATWCDSNHRTIPGMLEAYQKYHDKGFEIVSICIWETGPDIVASVKEYVEQKKLPWTIISETLTHKAGQQRYGASFAILDVPTMLLVDQTGKIIMTNARGEALQSRLAEIFE